MKYSARYILSLLLMAVGFTLMAQQPLSKGDIIVKTAKSPHKGRVVLKEIENLRDDTVAILIINEYELPGKRDAMKELKPRQKASWDVTFNVIKASLKRSNSYVEVFRIPMNEAKDKAVTAPVATQAPDSSEEEVYSGFGAHLDTLAFFSADKLAADSATVAKHVANLNLASIDKKAYIAECVESFVAEYDDSLQRYAADSLAIVEGYLGLLGDLDNKDQFVDSLMALYNERLEGKAAVVKPLKEAMKDSPSPLERIADAKLIIVCAAVLVLCVILIVWFCRVNKKTSRKNKKAIAPSTATSDAPALVVVGPRSTATLKKQSLDDVYDNESYLKINTCDFCENSLVRTIYIKNSCIKDIYNMYAEDLRNPDNPKEDGCMVLGRWVHDEKHQKYDISLEEIVLPGDDAVFAEYELNFGGKIKLRMSEKLRKLRKETGLQYDLTCWVHSHPGLGVFFSSSDNNVQHQLKHPSHPGFLSALVIDILTPEQEMGIFTFRDSDSVNSKNDLTRMYSLEEMYKKALQSERKSFDSANHFDLLGDAREHLDSCYGIQLNNSAIIDMTFLTSKPNGFIGFAHGYTIKRGERVQCVVSLVNGSESSPNTDMLGCFIVASHCSIPSIRKAVAPYLRDIHFVLVYTASDGLLTAIPVVDKNLSSSDMYYGEHELDNLKIWTRRRR